MMPEADCRSNSESLWRGRLRSWKWAYRTVRPSGASVAASHGGLVVSSVADSSTEFDVRQANSYAIVKGEKEMVDEQERQERNTRT